MTRANGQNLVHNNPSIEGNCTKTVMIFVLSSATDRKC